MEKGERKIRETDKDGEKVKEKERGKEGKRGIKMNEIERVIVIGM
jgi:hypothetical protein